MERKLLSLPSFFVLLLIAGIAFLAAPVEDVDADAPTVASKSGRVSTSGDVVVTFTFSEALTPGTGGPPITNADDAFDISDVVVTKTAASPASATASSISSGVTVSTVSEDLQADPPITANTTFRVVVAAAQIRAGTPAVFEGTVKVAIKPGAPTTLTDRAQFEAGTGNEDYAATTANSVSVVYDNVAPAVTIAAVGFTASGTSAEPQNGPFEVMFTLTQAPATTGAGVFVVDEAPDPPAAGQTADPADATTGDVTITGGSITEEARNPGTNVWRAIITPTPSTETAKTTEVKIKVAAGAVMDAAGNPNSESNELTVMIDNDPPTVTVAPAYPAEADQGADATGTTPAKEDKDGIKTTDGTHSAYSGDNAFKIRVTIEGGPLGTDAAAFDASDDLMVTGGEVSGDATADPTTLAVDYIVTIAQDDTTDTQTVVIKVPADAVMDAAGNGNMASTADETLTVSVSGGSDPVDPGTTAPVITGDDGNKLTGDRVGFSFTVNLLDPNDANTNRHLVLAKKPSTESPKDGAGFTSGVAAARLIDIRDEHWVDLRHFLVTREGGTIDLIKQGNRQAVKSLVISEVMWGYDAGLGEGNESNSQWIELYNTTDDPIDGTWELVFTAASRGGSMVTGEAAKVTTTNLLGGLTTSDAPVVDKLSTWRDVGNFWDWRISDTVGGSHGQSGKSTPNSATSVGSQQELVSMQRKINYTNVVKTHDTDDGVKNRTEQLKAVPGGVAADNWEATPEHGEMLNWRKGTPGARPTIKKVDQSGIARGSVVFNEIANRNDKKHDWIELYNKSGSAQKINGWELSLVTATGTDTELFTFTSDDDINVPAKGFLLVVNTDPRHTTLEGGYDVANPGNSARQSDGVGANKPSRLYYVSEKLDIPEKDFLLILRKGNDKTGTHEKVEDVAGNNPRFDDDDKGTQVWPLNAWSVGALDDLGQKNDKTWVRDQGKAVFHGDAWKPDGGFTGVGIARNAGTGNYTSGTPGYANNAVQTEVKSDGLTNANPVIISEIMFATDGRSPQWIELHNPSHTQAVNLKGWKLEIFNYYGDETLEVNHYADLKSLPEVRIQPNQTILIVSRATSRTSDSDAFPSNRIIDVWANTELRDALDMQNQRDAILSARGFYLKLSDPRKTVVDEVGNIDTNRRTNDEPDWELPGGALENGRSAMVRDLEGSAGDGTAKDAWRDASMVDSSKIQPDATELYYGDEDDVGTPGYTPGGVLPVQLSSFYSKRNDAGAVVITWSTESELDNAGFNILRSQSRMGEFTRINAQLIPGAGTTGEKTAYTWTDTSAKPNVLYFYQIEDVSLEGAHRTLRTTRLRGHVGAAGKVTTTWGDLKSRE